MKSQKSVFDIRERGAVGDGKTLDTGAVQAAIDACHAAGGGVVYCPPGDYLVGTIKLKSNVELHVEAGATLLGSGQQTDYPMQDYDAAGIGFTPQHFIFAHNAENIAITGRGKIDGNGRAFFSPRTPDRTHMCHHNWRPGHMIALVDCRDVLIRDVQIVDSPCFTIWPLGCDRVRIHGITILNNREGPNSDGIDPDCCRGVHISDCYLDCGDDCIALKSDSARLGRDKACEDVVVTNCTLHSVTCGIRVGYEGDSPIRNCTFSNLTMTNTRTGICIQVPHREKVGRGHGPAIENISFSNIVMDTRLALFLWIGDDAATPGCVRNINISNLTATTERGCFIGGSKSIPAENIRLNNIDLTVRGEMDDEMAEDVPYPYRVWEYWRVKRGIPHALYVRDAQGVSLRDIRVRWGEISGDWRSALRCERGVDLDIDGLLAGGAPRQAPAHAVRLTDVQRAFLRGCRAARSEGVFLRTDGDTQDVSAIGNDPRCTPDPRRS